MKGTTAAASRFQRQDGGPTCGTCGAKALRRICRHCGADRAAAPDPAHVAKLNANTIRPPQEETNAI